MCAMIQRIHFPFGFHLTVLYGPDPSSSRGLHFLSNKVALAGITKISQGKHDACENNLKQNCRNS
uniref:Eukaryotic translation initiation factor 2A-like n=1 Tax=Rhizophora mucronata TaxID=61149 RepID=A0A2P2LM69_RHIMU